MLFGDYHPKKEKLIKSVIQGVDIEIVEKNTFLGVIYEEKLNWKPRIKHLHAKVSRSVGVLCRARSFLVCKSLHILYSSLVLPYLSNCAEIWGKKIQNLNSLNVYTAKTINYQGI